MTPAHEPLGYCTRCGYRMDAGTCPECGADVPTPAASNPVATRRRVVRAISIVMVVLLVVGSGGGVAWAFRASWMDAYWPTWHLQTLRTTRGAWSLWAQNLWSSRRVAALSSIRTSAAARARTIAERDAEGTDADWAGTYVAVHNVHIFPQARSLSVAASGFVYCRSEDGTWNHGTIAKVTDGEIELSPVIDSAALDISVPRRWMRVRWGDARFLIPREHIVSFANSANAGGIALVAGFMCRVGDPPPSAQMPTLTGEFRSMIHEAPLTCRITAVGECATKARIEASGLTRACDVWVDAGRLQNVFQGMILVTVETQNARVKIIDVRADWALAKYEELWPESTTLVGVECTSRPDPHLLEAHADHANTHVSLIRMHFDMLKSAYPDLTPE